MATEKETLEPLRQHLVETLKYSDKEMAERQAWGAINFKEAQSDLQSVLGVARELKEMPIDALPNRTVAEISNHLESVNKVLKQIDDFSIEQADPAKVRTEISRQLKGASENLYLHTAPWLAFLAYKRGDIAKTVSDLEAAVTEAENIGARAKTQIEKLKADAENILQSMRQAAAEAGVAVFTEQFATEADHCDDSAINWLRATIIGAFLTGGAAILFLYWPNLPDQPTTWDMGRVFTTKLAVLALLFSATVWCSRNFRALKHQVTVNKHRALSLQTFQAFVGATEDARTKDAVLMEATRAIFGNSVTGFAEPAQSTDSGIQFVEIGKSVAEKAADKATT